MSAEYKIAIDTHCHTIASTHAYGTITENITAAANRGLAGIVITDHGTALPDSPHLWHFYNMRILPAKIDGLLLLRGIEANIIGQDGELDMQEDILSMLDWVIASLHSPVFAPGDIIRNTEAMINAIRSPYVNLIGHPDAAEFPIDIPTVVRECLLCGKYLEINNGSFRVRAGSGEISRLIALECMKQGAAVVVNSDAHCPTDIGDIGIAAEMLDSISFPVELILNRNIDNIAAIVNKKHGLNVYNR